MPEFVNNPLVPLPPEPEAPPNPVIESMSDADLDALLPDGGSTEPATFETQQPEPPAAVPAQEPPTMAAGPPLTAADVAIAAALPADPVELDPAEQIRQLREENERRALELQKYQAEMVLQKAHGSRLAGKVGYLESRLRAAPSAEPYAGPDLEGGGEDPQLGETDHQLLHRLAQSVGSDAVKRAIDEASRSVPPPPESVEIQKLLTPEEIQAAGAPYAQQWQEAQQETDPRIAAQIARACVLSIQADLRLKLWDRKRETAVAASSTQAAALLAKKRAANPVPSSRAARPAPMGPKTPEQLTNAELDALLP